MGAPSVSAAAETVWVPVISKAAGLHSFLNKSRPDFDTLCFR